MAVYYKPQSPIQSGEDFIYPITTADQVKVDKDTRLNAVGVYLKNIDNSTDTTVYGNNATTLGGVAAEDYALKTDTAPDSAKLGGKAPEYYIQPRNLLDNSDFRNPVNQRGKTSYSGIWMYSIDRWTAWLDASNSATVSVINGGITPYPGMVIQRIESKYIDSSKTYTLAAMTGDGLLVLSGKITSTSQGSTNANNGIYFDYNADSDTYQFSLVGSTSASKFVWAALYEGSYTAETLPPYVPKGYAAELAECQRYYYQSFPGSSAKGWDGMIVCEAIKTARATNVFFPQTMRIEKPTVTLYSPFTGNAGKASEFVSDTEVDVDTVYRSRYAFMLNSAASAFEVGKHYCIHYTVSADL